MFCFFLVLGYFCETQRSKFIVPALKGKRKKINYNMQISQTGQVHSWTACQGFKEQTSVDTLSVFGALG